MDYMGIVLNIYGSRTDCWISAERISAMTGIPTYIVIYCCEKLGLRKSESIANSGGVCYMYEEDGQYHGEDYEEYDFGASYII